MPVISSVELGSSVISRRFVSQLKVSCNGIHINLSAVLLGERIFAFSIDINRKFYKLFSRTLGNWADWFEVLMDGGSLTSQTV